MGPEADAEQVGCFELVPFQGKDAEDSSFGEIE